MLANNFQALLTFDKHLRYQQNFSKYTLIVLVLNAEINTYAVLTNLSAQVKGILQQNFIPVGPVVIALR